MRELKFRVYSDRYKRYLDTSGEGIFCEVHHLALKPDGKLYYADISIEYPGTYSECPTLEWEEDYEDCIIEQYTGLKDKNGKEIYEGDIIKWNDCILKVIWENDCACFELAYMDNKVEEGMCVNGYVQNYEIIGNIHENKELIDKS